MKKSYLCHFWMLCSFFTFTNSIFAQDYETGIGGLTIGSVADSTYSALLINGPNRPFYVDSKRDVIFQFREAGKSVIRAYRGMEWGTFLQFMTSQPGILYGVPQVRLHIDEYGRIGIGTDNPQNKLDVNGTIRAKEILVESNWADFVFKQNYKLPTLREVEEHIKEKGTLPNVPSEEEVKANGINVGKTNALLLQKIEELTLYVIQQQKEIEELKRQIMK